MATVIDSDSARSRVACHGSGLIGAVAKATGELAGGDILSWNLTLAGLLGSPFNLYPQNSVVYLQRSRVSATGRDVTFHYNGDEGDGQDSENSFFEGNRGCSPSEGFCLRDKTAPENIFDAAAPSSSDVHAIASLLPAAPKPATWTLMLMGFATLGLVRVWLRNASASA